MNTRDAYNEWARTYDAVENKTRNLEAHALQNALKGQRFNAVLEIGCGTGKNTEGLGAIGTRVTAVDFSENMLAAARQKVKSAHVQFVQADILQAWHFAKRPFDLVTFSLVLEHIENLDPVFREATSALEPNGLLYACELHPFKQYQGSKARFETGAGVRELECFVHHASDYFRAASSNGLSCVDFHEWFDGNDRSGLPRLVSFLFKKV